jgi:hypothetical protein
MTVGQGPIQTIQMATNARAKSLADWILLWFFRNSERREILGVPVGVPSDLRNTDAAFAKITSAFDLLHAHGTRSFDDMQRHTNGVFVWATAGARGEWHPRARLVVLEETYVCHEGTSAREIASTLVHESTHARLDAKGFAYSGERRARIENVCFRRQLAFARRLAEPGELVGQAERQLRRPPSDFTSEAWRQRSVAKLISLGVPKWLAHAIEWIARRRAARPHDVKDPRIESNSS